MGVRVCERVELPGHRGAVLAACFAGKYVLTAGADKSVRLHNPLRDAPQDRQVAVFTGPHGYELVDVSVSSDSSFMACCGKDKCGFVWDVESQQVVQKLFGHSQELTATSFAPTNNLVATGAKDCTVRIFDLRSPNPAGIMTLRGFRDNITAVHMTAAEILAIAASGELKTFDVRNAVVSMDDFGGRSLSGLAVSADESCALVTCVDPGKICMIDRESGLAMRSYEGHSNKSNRIPAQFLSGKNFPDLICGGSEDGEVWLWEMATGRETLRVQPHSGPLSALACSSPAHASILSAGYDGQVFVHRVVEE
mmetsp:Transcript_1290/g.3173  ORF Transcript_1290/g.3173 Transcript_1290/m.3173 type:complete len:309 (-) Transcript_1290:1728-2654(-)